MPKSPRPAALVRAEDGAAPVKLTKPERALVDEGCRRAADMVDEVEASIMAFGRWLLEAVFGNDAAQALDDRTKNPVWLELVRRAGGPTLSANRRMLYVALHLAARDKRIADQAWRNLDAGRKELLLPLKADKAIREAAQHVAKFNLTYGKTHAYVTQLLSEQASGRQTRITSQGLASRVRGVRTSLEGAAVLKRVKELRAESDPAILATMTKEVDHLRNVLTEISRALRGR